MSRRSTCALVLALVAVTAATAAADPTTDYAAAVERATTNYWRGFILSKLHRFEVGPACATKLAKPESDSTSFAMFPTGEVADYAKAVTGDDWATLEGSGTTAREEGKPKVESLIEAFRDRLSVTVKVDGADCDVEHGSVWMAYWNLTMEQLVAHPPGDAKVNIVIHASAKAKKFTGGFKKGVYTFVAPLKVQAGKYPWQVQAVFEKQQKANAKKK